MRNVKLELAENLQILYREENFPAGPQNICYIGIAIYLFPFLECMIITCFMDFVWAADPTRDTDKPTLMAGRIPL